ncbi:hypothetical protein ASPWEDRAFT_700437 [Aspergillus wentii DTO 134E9]|uniref:CBM1 domain-containing protein n=1 Tax=Aspergillus wentii DTO 134E9 TaxID=1073089 RepID=A0A1L9R5B5_ASPWE|nr:uncharacterized protein ASPWEDRAFT_700437 [Aspergillus wentii DTO 134E9]OJJ30092.1 hypothetical protein ASPWEDRAFT_700437 [Aspergillus wentii DTO 134E9]
MQFTNIILALMASSMVMAAPAQDSGSSTDSAAVSCPSGWIQCGECNGTSCKVAGTNRAVLEMELSVARPIFLSTWTALEEGTKRVYQL